MQPHKKKSPVPRILLAVMMMTVGVLHFVQPDGFVKIVPRWLPAPLALVYISGVFEFLGGAGLLVARTRRLAGWGLAALYVAVFPANINMAVNQIEPDGMHLAPWMFWFRLPLQILLIAWALSVARPDKPPAPQQE